MNRPFLPSDATFGQSGGPVLIKSGEGERPAGVMVGGQENTADFAVTVENWRELAEKAVCP